MSGCNHDCSSCSKECGERDLKIKANELSNVKKVIAVVSGKGGVGKSLVTSLLAVNARRNGKSVAVIDADVTGPSIPTVFGLKERATGDETHIFPVKSKTGIECMSLNLLSDDPTAPVIWRGPVIAGLVKQFWSDVAYGEIDQAFIDMPPGTGDVPLTIFQSYPIDGIIIVTSPQDLVSLIVEKAINMAKMMNIPILGVVSNFSYIECPDCGKKIYPYGQANEDLLNKYNLKEIEYLPIDPKLAQLVDEGNIELYEGNYLAKFNQIIDNL